MPSFNEQLQADGRWISAGGLVGSDGATTVDNRGGAAVITDGPFAETREYLAGFWILDVEDADVARALALEASTACHRKVELRQFH